MAGELVTSDYEVEFRGYLCGGETAAGLVPPTSGLTSMPGIRGQNHQALRRHGSISTSRFLDQRVTVWQFELDGIEDPTVVHEFESAFTLTNDEQPIVFQLPNVARGHKARLYGRVSRRSIPHTIEHYYGLPAPCFVEIESSDPRIYADALSSVIGLRLAEEGDGLTWPLSWPLDWGAESAHDGTFVALNNGTFETPAVFTISGPVVNPRIENVTQGRTLGFNLTIADGSTLVVDTKARTVLLDGSGNRYGFLTSGSRWFDLAAGGDTIRFEADSGDGTLSAEWRSAWI